MGNEFDPDKPFATACDLQAAWRPLKPDEFARAEKLLSYAERRIRAMLPAGWQDDPSITSNLEMVTVESVRRQMASSACGLPVTQVSQAGGGYTASATLQNPAGDWYLKADEKEALGIGGCQVFSVVMGAVPDGRA